MWLQQVLALQGPYATMVLVRLRSLAKGLMLMLGEMFAVTLAGQKRSQSIPS